MQYYHIIYRNARDRTSDESDALIHSSMQLVGLSSPSVLLPHIGGTVTNPGDLLVAWVRAELVRPAGPYRQIQRPCVKL